MITIKLSFAENESLITSTHMNLTKAKEYYLKKDFTLIHIHNPTFIRWIRIYQVEELKT